MTSPDVHQRDVVSFFSRLESLDSVLRIIVSDARLRARFTIRGDTPRSVLLDLTEIPTRAVLDDESLAADVQVAMSAADWHAVLSGAIAPGEAFGRRQMLLRGSASHLARFIPLFDFAPMLYRDHTAPRSIVEEGSMSHGKLTSRVRSALRRDTVEQRFYGAMNDAAYALGYGLGKARGRLDKLSLFSLLESMSRGIAAASAKESQRDAN